MSFIEHIFDNRPGLIITMMFVVVIGGFIIIHPSPPSTPSSAKPTPTPMVTSIKGHIAFNCATDCSKDFSAYDIAAYSASDAKDPIAQGQIQSDGSFALQLVTGSYYLKTIPESSLHQSISVTAHTPTLQLTITP